MLIGFGWFLLGGVSDLWLLRHSATLSMALIDDAVVGIGVGLVVFLFEQRNMTQRNKGENAVRQSEQRFRLAMNNVASGLYTLDLEGRVTYVNPAAEAMLGWVSAELLSKKIHDVTHYKYPDGTPFPARDCPGLQVLQKGIELRAYEDTFILGALARLQLGRAYVMSGDKNKAKIAYQDSSRSGRTPIPTFHGECGMPPGNPYEH